MMDARRPVVRFDDFDIRTFLYLHEAQQTGQSRPVEATTYSFLSTPAVTGIHDRLIPCRSFPFTMTRLGFG